jgi:hypothetical protein
MREDGGRKRAEADGSGGGVDPATASDEAFGEGEEPRTDEQGQILDVDADEALTEAIEKYETRIVECGDPGSGE